MEEELGEYMDLNFDLTLAEGYKSGAQRIRRITEGWVGTNMFCPRCGNSKIKQFTNNRPVADFFCPQCGGQFELKSKNGGINGRVNAGAYKTMIERITSSTNPDFLFLTYSASAKCVKDLIIVPKHFFVPGIIEKRPPLALTAKRAGWVGCNILLSSIPEQGRVFVIQDGREIPRKDVIEKLKRSTNLSQGNIQSRGWLFDVLRCVNALPNDEFSLVEMYSGFEMNLSKIYLGNHNIKAKIRQQLQLLRDAGYIEFLGGGKYRKLH
ncbi:DpnI domain-containing protein [Cloacibacillus porcorum]